MKKVTADDFRTFPLLSEVESASLSVLATSCSAREYGVGELIIGHNDANFDVFFLLKGKVQVSLYSADGQRVGFHEMDSGVMFGEISAIDGLPRSTSAEAAGTCLVAVLPRKQFHALMSEHPAFARAVARQLAGNVRRLTTRVFEFSTMAVRQRLRAELLRLAERTSPGAETALIDPVPTHAELASRISTHREAVSREMAWLDSKGLTSKQGRSLLIPQVSKIRALLEQSWDA